MTSMTVSAFADQPLAVSTRGLRKTYVTRRGRQVAVAGLDLDVPAGGVHGFLGPNGSGKTTSIRMLLGLIRADAGSMAIFDHDVPRRLPEVVGRVGAIVESPRFFPNFSGRRNLTLLAEAIGTPKSRVDAVLEEVGLSGRGKDPFRAYSLGMKQRLAVAATLLKDPDLLIFDEPTNGLDPAGIREVRDNMRALAARGKTVLVSSHILAEVEHVADTVSIITQGRLVAAGHVRDILGTGVPPLRLRVADLAAVQQVLTTSGLAVRAAEDALLVDGVADPATLTRLLADRGHYLRELTPVRADLESVFLQLTQPGPAPDGGPPPPAPPDPPPALPTPSAEGNAS